jgi:hypothetical protein
MEISIVRENLMTQPGYTPYCGNINYNPKYYGKSKLNCHNPRTKWDPIKNQMVCPNCGWVSKFPEDFIQRYKLKWEK